MNWKNLRSNLCPKCGADLTGNGKYAGCTKCDFTISTEKLEKIIVNINKQSFKKESEEEINSLYRN